ncbi:uncharacterized protein ACA1_374690 [Acanthamoeba castellanii str. Neff]|uniref:Uncharacterized protein n=1 Tax=Acanthamoeba castellanii (strain ATCC 30010 / Neff) TaxID=1257118 RepID=L8GH25_ACACF|nr:uncharacterized protein ACA1_374690 [Acanthamoeba castellanii str. Neff]ELR12400.1 hypothetical protein ACA1_374690 [Acanthamoeba castellanii str. Neff]
MDEPGRVGGPLIRPLSYYLQSPSPQVHLQPPAEFASRGRFLHQPRVPSYNHNSTEKLLLEADLLFNELQSSSSPTTATRLLTKTRDPLPDAAAASEPAATTKTKARKPAEATVTSTAAAPTKRRRVEQGAEDERYERVEVSELEQASAGQIAEPSRDSDSDSDKKKKKTKERKSRVAEKNTKKDEKEKAKGKRARRSADEARQEDEEEGEEDQPKRRRRIRRTEDKKARQARPTTTSSDGRWKTGKYVCAEHFRDKCATCKERTPVYLKYGITFAVNNGRNFVCLHPRRDFPNEPCGVRFTTQHELVEHRLAHEASERPGGLVRQEVLDRRLEVSAAVVQRMMKELDESPSSSKSKSPSESTVLIAALIDGECARLGYEEKCKPSAEVVHQRYRWARYRQLKFDSAEELLSEHMRLQRRLQLKMMETLMREDIPMADLDQGWVVARIAHLWDQVKDQRRGIPYTKSTIVGTVYNWARRTYSKPVPPIFPPINRPKKRKRKAKKRRRKEEKRKEEKMNKKEEEEEVQSQSDDSYNGNDNEDSEDTAVNDDPDNNNINYDEDTEDEGLATGMEVNEAEEEGEEEEEKKKQNESATNSRSRGGDVGGREAVAAVAAARSPPAPPSAVGKAKTTNAHEGLTGRELVLARRRHVMQTLDLLLASQLDK